MAAKAIGYVRVSRVAGREGDSFLSPDLQRQSIERVCQREGLTLIDVVEELDASGGDNTRPLWNRCLERIEKGEAQALVVWNLDRFSRSIVDGFRAIERIEAAGGRLISEDGASTTLDRGMRFVIAQDYRERAREGFLRAVATAIERGVYISRRVPFGYIRVQQGGDKGKLVPDPETRPIVVEAFERRAKGHSWVSLARWLGAQGGPSSRSGVRDMIHNVAYRGWARQGDIVNKKAHEAIVPEKLFDEAGHTGTAPRHDGSISSKTLLAPICGTCGHRMQANNSQGKTLPNGKREKVIAYSCLNLNCDARAYTRASELDSWVVGNLFLLLEKVGTVDYQVPGSDPTEALEARKALEIALYARNKFLKDREQRAYLSNDEYNELLRGHTMDVQAARIAVEMAESEELPNAENIKALWAEWTNETKREWLRSMVVSATIEPAYRKRGIPIVSRAHIVFTGGWEVGSSSGNLATEDDARAAFESLGMVRSPDGTQKSQDKRQDSLHLSE